MNRRRSILGIAVTTVLLGCQSKEPPVKSSPMFESRYLYDMRTSAKAPRAIAIELDKRPSLTETQQLALDRFGKEELVIFPEVRRRIYDHYSQVKKVLDTHFKTSDPEIAAIMPDIHTGTEIDTLVTLSAIEVAPDGRRVLLMYETEWDVEHGLNILLLDGAIERVGLGVDVFLPPDPPAVDSKR